MIDDSRNNHTILPTVTEHTKPESIHVLDPFEPIEGAPDWANKIAERDHRERCEVLGAIRAMNAKQDEILQSQEYYERSLRSHRLATSVRFNDTEAEVTRAHDEIAGIKRRLGKAERDLQFLAREPVRNHG